MALKDEILIMAVVVIHYFILFLPILLYIIPIYYTKKYFKYIFLAIILLPLHWALNGNKCWLTEVEKSIDEKMEETSNFSRKHLKFLYKPIMDIIGLEWENDDDLIRMTYIHWAFNFIILWIKLFFVNKCSLVS